MQCKGENGWVCECVWVCIPSSATSQVTTKEESVWEDVKTPRDFVTITSELKEWFEVQHEIFGHMVRWERYGRKLNGRVWWEWRKRGRERDLWDKCTKIWWHKKSPSQCCNCIKSVPSLNQQRCKIASGKNNSTCLVQLIGHLVWWSASLIFVLVV